MKKLSSFLVAIMLFVMVATAMGTTENVMAFSSDDINWMDYNRYYSGKAGNTVYAGTSVAAEPDVTGWKAAVCPEGAATLESAVCTADITAEDVANYNNGWYGVSKKIVLPTTIEGNYQSVIFDADGTVVGQQFSRNYVNKEQVSADFELIGDNGYVYAFVYSESPLLNANTYPTLYGADKTTALTTFDSYTVTTSDDGATVHFWRLNVLDAAQVKKGETLHYQIGTPTYDVGNDGQIGLYRVDSTGFDYTIIRDAYDYKEKPVVDPFAGIDTPTPAPSTPVVSTNTVTGTGNAGASVSGTETVLPNGTVFSANELTEGTDYDTSVAAATANFGAGATFTVFKMDLTDANGAPITQLSDFVKVSLPVPASLTIPEGKTLVVYRCENDGTLTRCNTTVNNGVITFETNHFSNYIVNVEDVPDSSIYYILAGADPMGTASTNTTTSAAQTSPKTGDVKVAPFVMAMVSAVGIAVVTMKKKHI